MTAHYEKEYPQSLPAAVPAGPVLVHNSMRPSRRQGNRGARYLLQPPADNLEVCDWVPELGDHYRIKGMPALKKPSREETTS
jgi:hypothetical protein